MKITQLLPACIAVVAISAAPLFGQCETTLFATNNSYSTAGATIYVDLTSAVPFTVESLEFNSSATVGDSVGLEVWTTSVSYVGNELDPSVWTQVAVDDGTGVAMGSDIPTPIVLAVPFSLPAGTTGVALVGVNTGHRYTNGTGSNQTYVGSVLTIEGGSATSVPFGGSRFSPRMFNGSFCLGAGGAGAGTSFCSPMPSNSTGSQTALHGSMSAPAGAGLHLEVTSGPPGEFGFFMVGSAAQDPGIAVSGGFLCLTNAGGGLFSAYTIGGTDHNSIGLFDNFGVFQNLPGTSTTGSGFDVPSTIPAAGAPAITAGSTWHFQVWHRDTPAGVGTSNFSNGLSVTF
ncbi:MAG: hypothetical protein JKY61_08225 [Planctomycetes bacterium]|nr:hypothetical protein [Planctomycetota bacterium]